jgi:D-glucosaminate-6-phosphate ammonia-lyase
MSADRRQLTRRRVLQAGAGVAAGGTLAAAGQQLPPDSRPRMLVYETLGVKPVINATGTFTALGGSVMPPEVVAAWVEASRHFVDLIELHNRVGERIAKLLGVEAAAVTTGAAGALLLGTAAAVTRGDRKLIPKLPDTSGMRNEVLIQKSHHSCYDNQLTDVGVKLIDVTTPAEAERAISERTAMMFFMNISVDSGQLSREAWVSLARKHKVPTLLDAAADVPPVERIAEYAKTGFDMIAVSGGKAIRGPNDTGLLLGRKDLIEAAKLNANPHCGTIGRMMKVGKEDMVALLAAVERFVKLDQAAERKEFERRIAVIEEALKGIPTVACERIVPPVANHVPHLQVTWDESRVKTTPAKAAKALADGNPSIRTGRVPGTGDKGLLVSVLTLQGDEEKTVAARLVEVLKRAAAMPE